MCLRREVGKEKTILAEARDMPLLPPEEADAEIRKLHLQVEDLEAKNGALEARNAWLERVIKAMCRYYCLWRAQTVCDSECPGRNYCTPGDLKKLFGAERLVRGMLQFPEKFADAEN
ncbi:MAG: hypothetical protein HY743_09455 [Deltaproteobacteria bacterium]|nr:hypothetical protein [Deltaproteobacteria bacterium]